MLRIPVILDTDIGGDIDDTWALAFLLRCPELDLQLVTVATGDTEYRARVAARLLEVAGRGEVPVAIGRPGDTMERSQWNWVESYDLKRYRGRVFPDAASALVRCIHDCDDPPTVIAIGPLTNVADALARDPRIARKARFVGMHGSIARSHDGAEGAIAEYNVEKDVAAARAVFAAPWRERVITPLDTCGNVRLDGEAHRRLAACTDPLAQAVVENYRIWLEHYGPEARATGWLKGQPEEKTSILYDTVAVHLAFSTAWLRLETLNLAVSDDGKTVVAPEGSPVRTALEWTDLAAYKSFLLERLLRRRA